MVGDGGAGGSIGRWRILGIFIDSSSAAVVVWLEVCTCRLTSTICVGRARGGRSQLPADTPDTPSRGCHRSSMNRLQEHSTHRELCFRIDRGPKLGTTEREAENIAVERVAVHPSHRW